MRVVLRDEEKIKAISLKRKYKKPPFAEDYCATFNEDFHPCNKVLELQFEDTSGETRAQIVGFVLDDGEVINLSQADGMVVESSIAIEGIKEGLYTTRATDIQKFASAPNLDEQLARYSLFIKNTKTNELEFHSFYTFGEMNAFLRVNENAEFDKLDTSSFTNYQNSLYESKSSKIDLDDNKKATAIVTDLLDVGLCDGLLHNRLIVSKLSPAYDGLRYNGVDYECNTILEYRKEISKEDRITSEIIGFITDDGEIIDYKDPLIDGVYLKEGKKKHLITDLNEIEPAGVEEVESEYYDKPNKTIKCESPNNNELLELHYATYDTKRGDDIRLYDSEKTNMAFEMMNIVAGLNTDILKIEKDGSINEEDGLRRVTGVTVSKDENGEEVIHLPAPYKDEESNNYENYQFNNVAKVPFEVNPNLNEDAIFRLENAYIAEEYKSDKSIDDFIASYYYYDENYDVLQRDFADDMLEINMRLFDEFREVINAQALGTADSYEKDWVIASCLARDLLYDLQDNQENQEKQNTQNVRKNR